MSSLTVCTPGALAVTRSPKIVPSGTSGTAVILTPIVLLCPAGNGILPSARNCPSLSWTSTKLAGAPGNCSSGVICTVRSAFDSEVSLKLYWIAPLARGAAGTELTYPNSNPPPTTTGLDLMVSTQVVKLVRFDTVIVIGVPSSVVPATRSGILTMSKVSDDPSTKPEAPRVAEEDALATLAEIEVAAEDVDGVARSPRLP